MRNARSFVLAVVAVMVAACADGGPTSPAGESPSFGVVGTEEQIRHQELKQQLATERARLKREWELGKEDFEIAEREWKAYREQLKRSKKLKDGWVVELLRCHPRPFEGDAEIIGPDGGTLHIGEHQLVIPRGALTEEQLIVAEATTSSLVDVEFSPEGLQFQRPAQLTVSYKNCDVPAGVDLRLVYLGVGNRVLEWPSSDDDRTTSEVTGEIHHFSRYAVAY